MKQNTLDLENQDTQAAILTLTHRRVFWRKCQERASYVAGEIRSVWNFFWRCIGWLLLQAAPTLFIMAIVWSCYAFGSPYLAPKPDPMIVTFEIEEIIVIQSKIGYVEKNGKPMREITVFSLKNADVAIVEKFFRDRKYTIEHEGYIPNEYARRTDHRIDDITVVSGYPDYLMLHGPAPEFKELRIRGKDVTVVLDPEHCASQSVSDRSWMMRDIHDLATSLAYRVSRKEKP